MIHLVTGGSGSGKSAFAESFICGYYGRAKKREEVNHLVYIATMIPRGKETHRKIARHREMRKEKGFRTMECYTGLAGLAKDFHNSFVLLECMSNLAANELYEPDGAGEHTVEAVMEGIALLNERCSCLTIVTNEVFAECGTDSPEMEQYKQILGAVNRKIAAMADIVTEVVYGIPVTLKANSRKDESSGINIKPGITERARRGILPVPRIRMVIGGAHHGKLPYAKMTYSGVRQWTDGAACGFEEIYTCEGLFYFEILLRRMMEEGKSTEGLAARIAARNPDVVIVTGEIGCGLVPVDAFQRKYREQTGRVLTELAALSLRVDRVVYGIGISLKGEGRL